MKESKKPTTEQPTGHKRFYRDQRTFKSDLYKLDVAKMKKNVAIQGEAPILNEVEHCHFFHSVDSNGNPQNTCTPIGGHFHVMEVIPSSNPDEAPIVVCKSGPMKTVRKKDRFGKYSKVVVPADPDADDYHTHSITFLGTSDVVKAQPNAEAVKAQNYFANKETAPPDVEVR